MMINLNGLRMTVIKTASNGVVNQDTLFSFAHDGDTVSADYRGGKIARGFLIGKLTGSTLEFSYCQLQHDGTLDHGKSVAEVLMHYGKVRLVEHFEWGSRPGEKGVNIFEAC